MSTERLQGNASCCLGIQQYYTMYVTNPIVIGRTSGVPRPVDGTITDRQSLLRHGRVVSRTMHCTNSSSGREPCSFVKDQAPHLDTLPSFRILGSVWVDKSRMWSKSCHSFPAVGLTLTLGIEALDEHGFLWGHVLHIPQLMLWIWGNGVRLALQGARVSVCADKRTHTHPFLEFMKVVVLDDVDLPRTS